MLDRVKEILGPYGCVPFKLDGKVIGYSVSQKPTRLDHQKLVELGCSMLESSNPNMITYHTGEETLIDLKNPPTIETGFAVLDNRKPIRGLEADKVVVDEYQELKEEDIKKWDKAFKTPKETRRKQKRGDKE